MKTILKLATPLLIATLMVTPIADAGRGKPQKPTRVTINSVPSVISGEVRSVRPCSARRTMVLYRFVDDERERAGTQVANADGAYQFRVFEGAEYQVEAPRKSTRRVVCKPGVSDRVEGGL